MTLPLRTVSESNARSHWTARAKRTKNARAVTELVARMHIKSCRVALPVVVTLVRIAPRSLDDDNLRGALKATRDGVADALGVDDRDERVEWRYEQRRPTRVHELGLYHGGYGVEVRINSRCVAHDDCRDHPELAIACWRSSQKGRS